ncbi:MAG TPA: hypothetical protein VK152_00050 [Paludibacter sp.]|nr:hypothetical protein [Paludibacter sp.]
MKILLCPLNWGLGHATRCVPLIQNLLAEGHEVVLVADGYPLKFLKNQFPMLRTMEFPSYPVDYAAGKSQVGAMLRNLPGIVAGIIREHCWLGDLLRKEHFDRVISDNRFGMWNKRVNSVYITHQLMVKMPRGLRFLEAFVHFLHLKIISNYDECWIPDRKENGLSGDLSHQYPLPPNARFIGTLSRFQGLDGVVPADDYEIVAVLSGIESQRKILEEILISKYKGKHQKVLIVCGHPDDETRRLKIKNLTLVSHLADRELASHLFGARKIIARSGYSTIMDLESLGCLHKAELIPTPGQTEQEYLAEIHKGYKEMVTGLSRIPTSPPQQNLLTSAKVRFTPRL